MIIWRFQNMRRFWMKDSIYSKKNIRLSKWRCALNLKRRLLVSRKDMSERLIKYKINLNERVNRWKQFLKRKIYRFLNSKQEDQDLRKQSKIYDIYLNKNEKVWDLLIETFKTSKEGMNRYKMSFQDLNNHKLKRHNWKRN